MVLRVLIARQRKPAGAASHRHAAGVDARAVRRLGGAFFPVPGIVSEKIHVLEVEVARGPGPDLLGAPHEGDGSPLEEGSHLQWRTLEDALRACDAGEIEDAKTEIGFRRLAARLAAPSP